jgi:hypothetical protein
MLIIYTIYLDQLNLEADRSRVLISLRLKPGPDLQIILWIISKKKYKIKIAEIP